MFLNIILDYLRSNLKYSILRIYCPQVGDTIISVGGYPCGIQMNTIHIQGIESSNVLNIIFTEINQMIEKLLADNKVDSKKEKVAIINLIIDNYKEKDNNIVLKFGACFSTELYD